MAELSLSSEEVAAGPTYYEKVRFILRRRRRGRKFGWRRCEKGGFILFYNLSEFTTHMYSVYINPEGEFYNPAESFVTWHELNYADSVMVIEKFKQIIDVDYKKALRRSFREWLRRAPKPVHHYCG